MFKKIVTIVLMVFVFLLNTEGYAITDTVSIQDKAMESAPNTAPRMKGLITAEPVKVDYETDELVYDHDDIRQKSNLSLRTLDKLLERTPLQRLAPTFVDLEDKYNVNLLYVVGIVSLESGWGKSSRANDGSNNLTGHAVYSDSSSGTSFSSWEACVEETFRLLSDDYLKSDGQWFSGYSIDDVNRNYCASDDWASKIKSIIEQFDRASQSMEFK